MSSATPKVEENKLTILINRPADKVFEYSLESDNLELLKELIEEEC